MRLASYRCIFDWVKGQALNSLIDAQKDISRQGKYTLEIIVGQQYIRLVDLQAERDIILVAPKCSYNRLGMFAAERPSEGTKSNPPHRLTRCTGLELSSQPFQFALACLELVG